MNFTSKLLGREFGPRVNYAPDDGGAAGGASGSGQPGSAGSQTNQNNNNSGAFDLSNTNIWEVPKTEGNNQTTQMPQPTQAPVDPNAQFNQYIQGLDFKFGLSPEDVQKFVVSGDTAGLQAAIQASQRNMYRSVLLDTSKMVNTSVERAVAIAVEKATGMYQQDKSRMVLEDVVPIAKNPNVAPIARATFQQFMKQGASADEAAKKTQAFFDALRKQPNTDFGLPPRADSGRGGFGQSVGFGDDAASDIDWVSFANSAG